MPCQRCGRNVRGEYRSRYCRSCSKQIDRENDDTPDFEMQLVDCPDCGRTYDQLGRASCPECDAPVDDATPVT